MNLRAAMPAALAFALVVGPLPALAQSETDMQRLLHDQIRYRNGLLVFHDKAGVTVAPATIPWTLDCGEGGVGVTLGSGTGETENGFAIPLGATPMTDEQCQALAVSLGTTMLAITQGK
jgi:hypothetical protein